MSEFQILVLSLSAYKLVTLLIGLVFGYFGYRLFVLGVYEKAGELKTTWGDKNLILKQASPGTFFALFGIVLIATALIKGLAIERVKELTPAPPASRVAVLNDLKNAEETSVIDKFVRDANANLTEKDRQVLREYFLKQETLKEAMKGTSVLMN